MDDINLIVFCSYTGSDVIFRVRTTTPLIKILEAYCDRMNINNNGMKLILGDTELCLSLTPSDYSFLDGTCIFVHGAHVKKQNVPLNPSPPIETVVLVVNDVYFKLRTTTRLIKILETYCDRMGLPCGQYKLYDRTRQLDTNLTSRDYCLQNNTKLKVQ